MQKIRWGIISTGNIAGKLADALNATEDAELLAVASRSQDSADRFGDRFNIPRRYPTYEALAADPDIDAIYVATPNTLHHDNTIMCLEQGKAVLCEKPFAMNAVETQAMIAVARRNKVFLMEAMWTRFMPPMTKVRAMIAEGALGEVRHLRADFGFRAPFDPHSRIFDPALGGGALLDVGIYPVSLASMLFGQPEVVMTIPTIGSTGVDVEVSVQFGYNDTRTASIYCSTHLVSPVEATILGTDGYIAVRSRWYSHNAKLFYRRHEMPDDEEVPLETYANGYRYQVEEMHRCLRAGQLESAIMPLAETLAIMQTMDRVQAAWA